MKKPPCKFCGTPHYLNEPHDPKIFKQETATKPTPVVTVGNTNPVTEVTPVTESNEPHCPTCRCFGPRYKTKAAKQAAYRARKHVPAGEE